MRNRILRYVLVFLVLSIAGLIVVIRIQQLTLRVRAERLHRDIIALRVDHSSYDDVQGLLLRWYASPLTSACQTTECEGGVELNDFLIRNQKFFSRVKFFIQAYLFLGGRPAIVEARFRVREGMLREWRYAVAIDSSSPPARAAKDVIGDLFMLEKLPPEWADEGRAYVIRWPDACAFCDEISARFTPAANSNDIQRLSRVDFSCLTRWLRPCTKKAEIMPAAWAEAAH